MHKGKINKEINIEEMIIKFPNVGDLLTELIRLQNSEKLYCHFCGKKVKVIEKLACYICETCRTVLGYKTTYLLDTSTNLVTIKKRKKSNKKEK